MVSRAGFTLVEVLVAVTLLSVGVLTLAASGAFAAELLRSAQQEEAATRLASALLDSLLLEPRVAAGSVTDGTLIARWSGGGAGLNLTVSYVDAGRTRAHTWTARGLTAVRPAAVTDAEHP